MELRNGTVIVLEHVVSMSKPQKNSDGTDGSVVYMTNGQSFTLDSDATVFLRKWIQERQLDKRYH